MEVAPSANESLTVWVPHGAHEFHVRRIIRVVRWELQLRLEVASLSIRKSTGYSQFAKQSVDKVT